MKGENRLLLFVLVSTSVGVDACWVGVEGFGFWLWMGEAKSLGNCFFQDDGEDAEVGHVED